MALDKKRLDSLDFSKTFDFVREGTDLRNLPTTHPFWVYEICFTDAHNELDRHRQTLDQLFKMNRHDVDSKKMYMGEPIHQAASMLIGTPQTYESALQQVVGRYFAAQEKINFIIKKLSGHELTK